MRLLKKIAEYAIIGVLVAAALNVPSITRYGVNGVLHTKTMPLYVKLGAFFYRDWMYKDIVSEATKESQTDINKVLCILDWVHNNILYGIPEHLKVMDDHPLNIIIRHYGEKDQIEDIFTILCSYAGFDALRRKCYTDDKSAYIILSFVKINGKWLVFDAARGKYFLTKEGRTATIEDCINDNVLYLTFQDELYKRYFAGLKNINLTDLSRTEEQKPLKRLFIQIKKIFKRDS